jgi:hypothetical protein
MWCHAVQKKFNRNGCIALCSLDLGTRWSRVASSMAQTLYPRGNRPWYPMNKRLDGPWGQSGCCRKEKDLLSLSQIEQWFLKLPSPEPSCDTERATYKNTFNYLIWIECILISLSHNQAFTFWISTNIGEACCLLLSGYFLGLFCPWRWCQYIPLKCQ